MDAVARPARLENFFAALDRHLERIMPEGGYRFRIRLGGRLLELQFPSQKQASVVERCMAGQIVREDGAPDSILRFWRDDCTRYIGTQHPPGGVRCTAQEGRLLYLPCRRLLAADLTGRVFYCCQHDPGAAEEPILSWVATALFDQWAQASGLLMLHGAAAGADGRGVLIAARGGGGKSTLSISCLLDGMDFVGDDVVLLSGSGPLEAMPYYTAVKLRPDMYQELSPDMPVILTREDGKLLLDASSHPFCRGLPIRAILCPKAAGYPEPSIRRTASGPVLSELIGSTVQSVATYYRPDLAQLAGMRLAGLPVYELQLSRDLQKNTATLRKFIEGMI